MTRTNTQPNNSSEPMTDSEIKKIPVQVVRVGELAALQVENHLAEATVLLQGAQVVQYQAKGQAPLLWENPHATYKHGKAVRAGIPVCWPWFGDLKRNPEAVQKSFSQFDVQSAHGFARNALWGLIDCTSDSEGSILTLALTEKPPGFLLDAKIKIHIKQKLKIELVTCNLSSTTVSFSQALHTYFPTASIEQTTVNGLESCGYFDALDDWKLKPQNGPISFTSETDRIYC